MKGILTKGQITKFALTYLRANGGNVWANNNVRAVKGRTFTGRKGVPDIIGFSRAGIFIGCEVKTANDKMSEEQAKFFEDLEKAGGLGLVAWEEKPGNAVVTKVIDYMTAKGYRLIK